MTWQSDINADIRAGHLRVVSAEKYDEVWRMALTFERHVQQAEAERLAGALSAGEIQERLDHPRQGEPRFFRCIYLRALSIKRQRKNAPIQAQFGVVMGGRE